MTVQSPAALDGVRKSPASAENKSGAQNLSPAGNGARSDKNKIAPLASPLHTPAHVKYKRFE